MSTQALRRKVLVRVTCSIGAHRGTNALGDLGQVAIFLELGLLVSLSRGCLARSVIGGGCVWRFHHGSPACQLCVRSCSQ